MRRILVSLIFALASLSGCQNEPLEPAAKTPEIQQPITKEAQPAVVVEVKKKVDQAVNEMIGKVESVGPEVEIPAKKKPVELAQKTQKQTKVIPPLPGVPSVSPGNVVQQTDPDIVVFEASQGNVTFPHSDHASRLACSQCHPTDPPEKIGIDKTFAHNTCRSCHKNSGAGPTGCKQCHVK